MYNIIELSKLAPDGCTGRSSGVSLRNYALGRICDRDGDKRLEERISSARHRFRILPIRCSKICSLKTGERLSVRLTPYLSYSVCPYVEPLTEFVCEVRGNLGALDWAPATVGLQYQQG